MVKIIEPSLFPEYFDETTGISTNTKARQKWTFEKTRNMGLEYCSNAFFQGRYGIVKLKSYVDALPDRMITLDEVYSPGNKSAGIACYAYDSVLTDCSMHLDKWVETFAEYQCVSEFDFSVRVLDPLAVVVANVFRSHALAYYCQEHGCKILPTMKWASEESHEVCFDGYEKGGAVMVSTIGVQRDERSRMYFKKGFKEMLRRISPDAVALYGDVHDWIMEMMPSSLYVRHYNHERFIRMREHGRQGSI